jgi:hypothetical protein
MVAECWNFEQFDSATFDRFKTKKSITTRLSVVDYANLAPF